MIVGRRFFSRVFAVALSVSALSCIAAEAAQKPAEDYFAIVGDTRISMQEYQTALAAGMRKRFYHGKIPEDKLSAFRQEVADRLVARALLLDEARHRGLKPDSGRVDQQLQAYLARYENNPQWRENRDELIRSLRTLLEEESLLERLESVVREMPEPDQAAVRAFYDQRPALFTTPEAFRVSIILLKVAPSSPPQVWEAAFEEAGGLLRRLKQGAAFDDLARIHSGHESAANGGDMGLLHQGMLAEQAESVVKALSPGEVSEPVMLLQGIAILRLEERRPPKLNAFDEVEERARQLLAREASEQAWQALIERLRSQTEVVFNQALFLE